MNDDDDDHQELEVIEYNATQTEVLENENDEIDNLIRDDDQVIEDDIEIILGAVPKDYDNDEPFIHQPGGIGDFAATAVEDDERQRPHHFSGGDDDDIDAMLDELTRRIEDRQVDEGVQPRILPSSSQQQQQQQGSGDNYQISLSEIPNYDDKWKRAHIAAVRALVQGNEFKHSTEFVKDTTAIAIWQSMLARSSELANETLKKFQNKLDALKNSAAHCNVDVPRAQASRCAECLQKIDELQRGRRRLEDETFRDARSDDIIMLRALKKTMVLLQGKFNEEERQIKQRAERNKEERDKEFTPRMADLKERFSKMQNQCSGILTKYGSLMTNLGPSLKIKAIATCQALNVLCQVLSVEPPYDNNVLSMVDILVKAIHEMQTAIDQDGGKTPLDETMMKRQLHDVHKKEELNELIAKTKITLKQCTEKIRDLTSNLSQRAMNVLSLWDSNALNAETVFKQVTDNDVETQMQKEIETLQQKRNDLVTHLEKLEYELNMIHLNEKRELAMHAKNEHPKWVQILDGLGRVSLVLRKDMQTLNEDRERIYEKIIEDFRRDMVNMNQRRRDEILKAATLLHEALNERKKLRMDNWQQQFLGFDHQLRECIQMATQMIEMLSMCDTALAMLASDAKKSCAQCNAEEERLKAIRNYVNVLTTIKDDEGFKVLLLSPIQ